MVRPRILPGLVFMLAACMRAGPLPATAAQGDKELAAVLRELVVDSLVGGGSRTDQTLAVSDDAGTDSLLRRAGVKLMDPSDTRRLACPASTDSAGAPMRPPVGYVVQVRLSPETSAGSRHVEVEKGCTFMFRGVPRGFFESGTWELRRQRGRWTIGRTLARLIS
jgi:hypothetical protein